MGNAGDQCAKNGKFLLSLKESLTRHQLHSQRRHRIPEDNPSQGRNQRQQQHYARKEKNLETGQRGIGASQENGFGRAMGVGELAREVAHAIGLGLEPGELAQLSQTDQGRLQVCMNRPARGEVASISLIQTRKQAPFLGGGHRRMRVQGRIVVINPAIKLTAGLLKLLPQFFISQQNMSEQAVIKRQQVAVNFARKPKSAEGDTREVRFKLLDALPGQKHSVNGAPSHQEERGCQAAKTNAVVRFHKRGSVHLSQVTGSTVPFMTGTGSGAMRRFDDPEELGLVHLALQFLEVFPELFLVGLEFLEKRLPICLQLDADKAPFLRRGCFSFQKLQRLLPLQELLPRRIEIQDEILDIRRHALELVLQIRVAGILGHHLHRRSWVPSRRSFRA